MPSVHYPDYYQKYLFTSVRFVKSECFFSEWIWREGWIKQNDACQLSNFTHPAGVRHLTQDCHARNKAFQAASTYLHSLPGTVSNVSHNGKILTGGCSLRGIHQVRMHLLAFEMLCPGIWSQIIIVSATRNQYRKSHSVVQHCNE